MAVTGFTPYDTNTLVQVIPTLIRPQSFLLDSFFPNQVLADSEFVSIDIELGKRRMSPFVSPMVEGKLVESLAYTTNVFKPAYTKDKRVPDVRRPLRRMIGERIGGDKDGPVRWAANIEAEMTDQIRCLTRRLEWMAASALQTGTVVIVGEGFPEVTINFLRDASLIATNSGGTKWTAANVAAGTAHPVADIEALQRDVLKLSGAQVDRIIFTTSSWDGFICDPLLKEAIYFPKLGDYGNSINIGSDQKLGAVYKGQWGAFSLWLYNDWFVNDSDVEVPMLTDGMVIVGGPDLQGTRAFGQILDPEFNYEPMAFAPKSWVSHDPAAWYVMMQSSPIVIPSRTNAVASLVACDAVYS
jgi:hypothetical protein